MQGHRKERRTESSEILVVKSRHATVKSSKWDNHRRFFLRDTIYRERGERNKKKKMNEIKRKKGMEMKRRFGGSQSDARDGESRGWRDGQWLGEEDDCTARESRESCILWWWGFVGYGGGESPSDGRWEWEVEVMVRIKLSWWSQIIFHHKSVQSHSSLFVHNKTTLIYLPIGLFSMNTSLS